MASNDLLYCQNTGITYKIAYKYMRDCWKHLNTSGLCQYPCIDSFGKLLNTILNLLYYKDSTLIDGCATSLHVDEQFCPYWIKKSGPEPDNNHGLSPGAIIGLISGLIFLLLVILMGLLYRRRYSKFFYMYNVLNVNKLLK